MVENATALEFSAGFITLTDSHGRKTKYPIASVLRAADIPTGLTFTQITAISTLASLMAVLIKTLISRGILDESFMEKGDYNLDAVIEVIENMGADYANPDITTTPAV